MIARGRRASAASRAAVAVFALAAFGPTFAAAEKLEPRLPPPGTYTLQRIQRAPQAQVLNAQGETLEFSAIARGAVTALAFFYSHCADPTGCPVAWSTFETARRDAQADALLKTRLRLVFVSLDPARDTPDVLRLLQGSEAAADQAIPWEFLTARSSSELAPLLRAMGEETSFETDGAGKRTGVVNHMLKVFLIDPDGWVREIYTTAFLTPESLLNDARTLAMAHPDASNQKPAP